MENSLHGEQISVTVLTIAKMQEEFLNLSSFSLLQSNIDRNYFYQIFDEDLAEYFWSEFQNKIIDQNRKKKIMQKLNNFSKIKQKLGQNFYSYEMIRNISDNFNLKQSYIDINLNHKIYSEAIKNANLIRNRFTILDLFYNII
jgi:glycerol dehydrogenase-like iron-containing ADH family enzyme